MSNPKTQIIAEPGKQEFFVTREFDAPKELVFTAFTDPALLVQWFMPRQLNLQAVLMDCRTGGSFHLTYPGPGGSRFGFRGIYHEISLNQWIIKTSEFEGLPQKIDPVLEKTTFEDIPGDKCKVTMHTICPSVGYRDNMIAAGMKPTFDTVHSQLDELLTSLFIQK